MFSVFKILKFESQNGCFAHFLFVPLPAEIIHWTDIFNLYMLQGICETRKYVVIVFFACVLFFCENFFTNHTGHLGRSELLKNGLTQN